MEEGWDSGEDTLAAVSALRLAAGAGDAGVEVVGVDVAELLLLDDVEVTMLVVLLLVLAVAVELLAATCALRLARDFCLTFFLFALGPISHVDLICRRDLI